MKSKPYAPHLTVYKPETGELAPYTDSAVCRLLETLVYLGI